MRYSLDNGQMMEEIVRPVLQHLGLHSLSAERLVLGTALVESLGGYIRQLGQGPALGLWQMEPATHDCIWDNYLKFQPALATKVREFESSSSLTYGAKELIGNLYYGAAMCRVHYRRVREALPDANSAHGMATYWKRYYNTHLGAGTVAKAQPHFQYVIDNM
jgi:hypothetical protein